MFKEVFAKWRICISLNRDNWLSRLSVIQHTERPHIANQFLLNSNVFTDIKTTKPIFESIKDIKKYLMASEESSFYCFSFLAVLRVNDGCERDGRCDGFDLAAVIDSNRASSLI